MVLPLSVLVASSALLCAGLIVALMPLLKRYALARPSARSSHRVPTPQGGGIAVLAATLLTALPAALLLARGGVGEIAVVAVAATGLAAVGAWDDIRPLPAAVRLPLQAVAVALVLAVAGPSGPVLGGLVPPPAEALLLLVAGVWFVNLVNFMDGLDWMTVAEFVPVLAFLALLALSMGELAPRFALAAALLGALLGFAAFNKPPARLFLGDVGSLPVGLLVGWLVLQLAGAGAVAAAVLLVLYPVTDATVTLMRRLARGEKVWQAHRTHFYQQATDNGFSVLEVSASVFALNLVLAALAFATLGAPPPVQAGAVVVGAALVAGLLRRFARPRRRAP